MPETRKILGQSSPLATTLTDAYTVPPLTETIVSSVSVCNRGSTASYFRISTSINGAADSDEQYLYYDIEIPPNDTFIATVGLTLDASDIIRVYSSTTNLSFHFYGVEIS